MLIFQEERVYCPTACYENRHSKSYFSWARILSISADMKCTIDPVTQQANHTFNKLG